MTFHIASKKEKMLTTFKLDLLLNEIPSTNGIFVNDTGRNRLVDRHTLLWTCWEKRPLISDNLFRSGCYRMVVVIFSIFISSWFKKKIYNYIFIFFYFFFKFRKSWVFTSQSWGWVTQSNCETHDWIWRVGLVSMQGSGAILPYMAKVKT